jgi:hypothetical protein
VRINHVVTTDSQGAEAGETRRTFYIAPIYGIWGMISAALTIPAIIYLLVPPRMRKQSAWNEAGDLSQVPTEMRFRRMRVDGWRVSSEEDQPGC